MNQVGPSSLFATLTARVLTAQMRLHLELAVLTLLLVGLLVLGITVIVAFKRWQAAQGQTPLAPRLEDYRALMEQGVLDPLEFERIRAHMEKKNPPGSTMPPSPPDHPM
jgi:hypothetical protein